jgi:hypothetical protein
VDDRHRSHAPRETVLRPQLTDSDDSARPRAGGAKDWPGPEAELAATTSEWEAYDRWNEAIAQEIYTPSAAGRPVYLDIEEDVLAAVARRAGVGESSTQALAAAVRGTLWLLPGGQNVFHGHLARLQRWQADPRRTPPTLALLAVLSLAAEAMRRGEGMSANNYYGRLRESLDVTDERVAGKLIRDYRAHAVTLWSSLNDWLEEWDGERGVPTAFAVTFPYIGLAISQALVRAADRRRLRSFFAAAGLSPGYSVALPVMQRLLDGWISQEPAPVSHSLRSLWQRDKTAQERITGVACIELEAWDGTTSQPGSAASRGELRLVALMRRLLGVQLELSLAARVPDASAARSFQVAGGEQAGDHAALPAVAFEPVGDGWLRIDDPTLVDAQSMVGATIRLTDQGSPLTLQRIPRRVVPLRRDESLQMFVESDRVQLGEDALVLCRDDVADRVEQALRTAARPGFTRHGQGTRGLPHGWVLFSDVEMLAAPEPALLASADLSVLEPATWSQLLLGGGLQLPGRIRKWESLLPPEVRAMSATAESVRVVVECRRALDGQAPEPITATSDSAALVLPLAPHGLADGDYQVALLEGASETASMHATLRLRSADTPAEAWDEPPSLGYLLGSAAALGGISASAQPAGAAVVRGAHTLTAPERPSRLADQLVPDTPGWVAARSARPTAPQPAAPTVVLGREDRASCAVTGAHYMELPADTGHPRSPMFSGRCRDCGVVKWYPSWPRRQRRARRQDAWAYRALDTRGIAPVPTSQAIPWDAALDALCHLRWGTTSELERIALQLDGSRLLADTLLRTLEALGHLDVARDHRTLRPACWQVAPTILAGLRSGEYVLVGGRSERLLNQLEDCVQAGGGMLSRQQDPNGPATVLLRALGPAAVEVVAKSMAEPSGAAPAVVPAAAARMAAALPPLHRLLDALPRISLPHGGALERWDTQTAEWRPAALADRPGAYKLRGTLVLYGIRIERDLADGTIAVGTAQAVKHLAALLASTVHAAYHARTASLVVPLGADLPGLYGRAAVLCSGRVPSVLTGKPLLCYHDVPREIAGAIVHALTH